MIPKLSHHNKSAIVSITGPYYGFFGGHLVANSPKGTNEYQTKYPKIPEKIGPTSRESSVEFVTTSPHGLHGTEEAITLAINTPIFVSETLDLTDWDCL